MKLALKHFLVLCFLLVYFVSYGQSDETFEIPKMVPASPVAYELGKYGQIPMGYFTGTPNISIPLFEYKAGKLSIPISLSYSSSGIKVDQLETNVGLGWSLNAGGVISKIVRDKPDEETNYFYPDSDIDLYGANSPMAAQFFYNSGDPAADTETDLFMYNFPGGSGKFVYGNDKSILKVPYNDLKIEPYVEGDSTGYKITTPDGIQYIFLEQEETINRVSGTSHTVPDSQGTTAWYLSKIIHPLGDEIDFIYADMNYTYTASQSQYLEMLYPTYQTTCGQAYYAGTPTPSSIIDNNSTIVGKKLVEIKSNNPENGMVIFDQTLPDPNVGGYFLLNKITLEDKDSTVVKNFNFDYLTTANARVFLNKITFLDPAKYYQFTYDDPEGLAERLSLDQDHWGYYNGANNTVLVPQTDDPAFSYFTNGADKDPNPVYAEKGLLTRVQYPTKGYNQLEYEGNTYHGTKTIPGQTGSVFLSVVTDGYQSYLNVVDDTTITVDHNQTAHFRLAVDFNAYDCDPNTDDLGKSRVNFTITDVSTSTAVSMYYLDAHGDKVFVSSPFIPSQSGTLFYADLTANTTYSVKLQPGFFCVDGQATFTYEKTSSQTVPAEVTTGGMRVKNVTTYDPVSNKTNRIRYYYGPLSNLDESSGDPGQTPYYISSRENTKTVSQPDGSTCYGELSYKTITASSLNSLFNTGNSNIYYQYVTESFGGDNFENGGKEYKYIVHRDYQGNLIHGVDYIRSAPWTNFGWDNSLLKTTRTFRKDSLGNYVILSQKTNNYTLDNRNYGEVAGFSVRKDYDLSPYSGDPVYVCKEADLTRTYTHPVCLANHHHEWLITLSGKWKCIAIGADNQTEVEYHPCYGKSVGDTIVYPENISNLDIMEYKTISYWHYLSSKVSTQYDENGLNPVSTVTRYFYDNAKSVQLTRTDVIDSKGDTSKTVISYPDDLGDAELINEYRISEPLLVRKYKNSRLLSTKKTEYAFWGDSLYMPANVKASVKNDILENRLEYHRYDAKGNPVEVSKSDGMHVVYLWAYNYSLPIAKIENATYADVMNALGKTGNDDLSYLQSYSNAQLISEVQKIRSALNDASVTTYVYKPLVGMTSTIDPNGVRMYYDYDSFGRLANVRDSKGSIVQHYKYHYAQ